MEVAGKLDEIDDTDAGGLDGGLADPCLTGEDVSEAFRIDTRA